MYRKVVWYLRGRKEYTRPGYEAASTHFNPGDLDVQLKGRNVMVTGSNSGIGYAVAEAVAQRGATLHMVCRSEKRAQEAKEKLVAATNNQDIHLHIVDMAKPHQIKELAEKFSDKPLDVLVNNAGCMVHERKLTEEGLEYNFAVNTFGPYLLTTLLMPALALGTDPRVVMVSSGGMLLEKLDYKDFNMDDTSFSGEKAYSRNKRQQVVMTEMWASKHKNIKFYSMHPGWTDTAAVRASLPEFYESMKDVLRTPEQGADTAVWCCVAETIPEELNGKFLQDRAAVSEHLPLAWTKSSPEDKQDFMKALEKIAVDLKVAEIVL